MGYVTIRKNAYLVVKKKFFGRKIFFSSFRLVINKWEEILSLGMSLIYLLGIYRYQSDTHIAARAIHISLPERYTYRCQSDTHVATRAIHMSLPERYIYRCQSDTYIAARAIHTIYIYIWCWLSTSFSQRESQVAGSTDERRKFRHRESVSS